MQVERFMSVHRSFDLSALPDSGPIEMQLLSHVLPLLRVRCSGIVKSPVLQGLLMQIKQRDCSKQCNGLHPGSYRTCQLSVHVISHWLGLTFSGTAY